MTFHSCRSSLFCETLKAIEVSIDNLCDVSGTTLISEELLLIQALDRKFDHRVVVKSQVGLG
jgi:hypothetical protein